MAVTVEQVIAAYIKTRDEIDQKKKEFEASLKPEKDLQEKRETYLAGLLTKDGVNTMSADSGSVFFKRAESVTVQDWDKVWEFIQTNERFDLLTHAVNKTAVLDEMGDEREQAPPPGVKYTAIKKVHVRRK